MPDGILNKLSLYSEETMDQFKAFTEKFGDRHFDAWDFSTCATPVTGLNRPPNPQYLGRIKLSEIDCPSKLWMIRLTELVRVDPNLVQKKVLADVLHGAEANKAWKDWVRVVDMDVPQVSQPTISEDDFEVYHGTAGGRSPTGGGKFGSVNLDCSEDKGLHTLPLAIKKTWIKDANWNAVQEATTVAGSAMYKHVASDVCTALASAAGGTESFDTDLYKTIVKAISTVRNAGFNVDAVLLRPTEEATLMAMDKFISIEQLGRVGRLAEEGVIGNFYGTIPVYSTSVMGANPIVYSRAKGIVVGLRQDIQIEEYNEPLDGLEGAVLTMRFDIQTAFSNAIRKVATT